MHDDKHFCPRIQHGTVWRNDMIPIECNIPASFCEEEVRWGYTVTKQRKEVWAVEIDLLMQLDRVCKQYDLKYCAGAGTLLGAVRHQGFIPWDDDIDVYMLREDYDKLMRLSDQFSFPYFLQNAYTEENLVRPFMRLRNSLTTGCTIRDEKRDINKGIFIDIFPLDGITEDARKDRIQRVEVRALRKLLSCYNRRQLNAREASFKRQLRADMMILIAKLFVRDRIKLFEREERATKRYSHTGTRLWGNRSLMFGCPKSRRPMEDYTDLIEMPFEFVQIPVPRNYDSMLRQQYGDYMKIPENKNQNMHGELIISTDYAFDDPRRINK